MSVIALRVVRAKNSIGPSSDKNPTVSVPGFQGARTASLKDMRAETVGLEPRKSASFRRASEEVGVVGEIGNGWALRMHIYEQQGGKQQIPPPSCGMTINCKRRSPAGMTTRKAKAKSKCGGLSTVVLIKE